MWVPHSTLAIPASGGVLRTDNDLQNTHLLRALAFEISLVCTNTGAVTYFEDSVSRLIDFRFYNGPAPDISCNGREFKHFLDTLKGVVTGYTDQPGTADTATTGSWNGVIPRSDPENPEFPDQTCDDLRLGDNPRVEFQIGAVTAMTAGTAVITSGTIKVYADLIELPADAPRARATTIRRFKSQTLAGLPTSATRSRQRFDYGEIIRRMMFMSRNNATPFARNDSRVTNIELVINGLERGAVSWTSLKSRSSEQFNIAMPTGIAFMEFDPAERLDPRMMLDLRGTTRAELSLDTDSTASDLVILQEQVILPTSADLAALGVK